MTQKETVKIIMEWKGWDSSIQNQKKVKMSFDLKLDDN